MKLFAVLPLLAAAVSAQIVNLNARDESIIKTIDNKATSKGLCLGNAKGEFKYSPENPDEILTFTIDLVSKENPVKLNAVYKNEATGETVSAVVSKDSTANTLGGPAKKGDKVSLTVQPEGASNDNCEYSVALDAKAYPGPSACPAPPAASTVTATATSTTTVQAPQPTDEEVCLCDCGTEGSKPLPNIEL